MRIAVLFDNFGPYHYARLNAASSGAEILGIETVARSQEYGWTTKGESAFEHLTISASSASAPALADIRRRLHQVLSGRRPNAVAVPGWSDKSAVVALDWCASTGTPAILMSESTAEDEPRVPWREAIKRRIIGLYSTALVGGNRHVEYLVQLGIPRERIFTGYDAVENEYFARRANEVRSKKEELRKGHQLPKNYFLASARFIEKKNLLRLIRAYAEYRKEAEVEFQTSAVRSQGSKIWDLVLLGDGPLRESLNSQLSALNLHDYVHLPGFSQYDELPTYYGLAQVFVHASTTEQWGLVVNEAMASGLPVIVSNRCGCVPELVQEGVNGFTFDPFDDQELAQRLVAMSLMDKEERIKMGEASQRVISGCDATRFGSGLKTAAEMALTLPRKHPGFLDRALLAGLTRFPR